MSVVSYRQKLRDQLMVAAFQSAFETRLKKYNHVCAQVYDGAIDDANLVADKAMARWDKDYTETVPDTASLDKETSFTTRAWRITALGVVLWDIFCIVAMVYDQLAYTHDYTTKASSDDLLRASMLIYLTLFFNVLIAGRCVRLHRYVLGMIDTNKD